MTGPAAIDIFCGAGGLSLGLAEAGFDVRLGVDVDPWSVKTYNENFRTHQAVVADLAKMSGRDLLRLAGLLPGGCALLAGGPPCQGFSVQRRGPDIDPRNDLVLEYLRLVKEIRPQFFLLENVSGLLSKRGTSVVNALKDAVGKLGYTLHVEKLDAAHFGIPQCRERVFMVGESTGEQVSSAFRFPKARRSGRPMTVRDAIGDLPSPPGDGSPHPTIPNHAREARLSPLNVERLKHIPPGGGREHLPLHLQLPCHRNNPSHRHMDVYGRLAWDAPSGTITARFDSFTRGRFAHPVEHRSLTLREGARLQTFPDKFVFSGNREECAKQIGNAVPPKLAAEMGRALLAAFRAGRKRARVSRVVTAVK